MKRRTFLKAVFAAAVAPPSVVEALYRPANRLALHTQYMIARNGIGKLVYYEGDELLMTGTMVYYSDEPKSKVRPLSCWEGVNGTQKFSGVISMPPEKIFFKGVELAYEGPVNFICKKRRANIEITPR
jgi:hypothetical protein